MIFLFKLMSAALMASRAMSALGVTILVGYGIYEFIKKQHLRGSKMRYLK
jgi:hypothetical protein